MIKRLILLILLALLISSFASSIYTPECVRLTYNHISDCQVGSYSAGSVFLSSKKLPQDSSLDGKYYKLSGQLLDLGYCTVLVVQHMKSCDTIK